MGTGKMIRFSNFFLKNGKKELDLQGNTIVVAKKTRK